MSRQQRKNYLKRAYDPPAPSDGYRVLIDRIWPRGVSRDALHLESWLMQLAPSAMLRKWFDHDPARWNEFKERYFHELGEKSEGVDLLLDKCRNGKVTLVFGAKDIRYNNAVALKAYLEPRIES